MMIIIINNKKFPQDEIVSPATQGLLVFVRDHSIPQNFLILISNSTALPLVK